MNGQFERDSVITVMRQLIAETNGAMENDVIKQKMCNEADEYTKLKDIANPDKLRNRFSVLENKPVELWKR